MKKLLMISLGVMIFGSVVWAVNVNNIDPKISGGVVSYEEFNNLVKTIKGLFNKKVGGIYKLGVNTPPSDNASLKMKGLIRVQPIATADRPSCTPIITGAIYADNEIGEEHLWGCNGSTWVQLDTQEPVCS